MAAAFFNTVASPGRAQAISAGTQPADRVHPEVVAAMREVGVDLASAAPRLLTDELARRAQVLVTMGCGEACPLVAGLRRVEWNIADPKDQSEARVREIRDEIRTLVEELVAREGWRESRSPALS
jgi:arsenate reductase